MRHFEDGRGGLGIAGLRIAVAGLSALAQVPYPMVLVVGGALFRFVPGLPAPGVMLVVFLLPLLYGESIYADFNDLRAALRALTLSPR